VNKDQTIRRLQQEIDSASFRNEQMACRIELLQMELDKNVKSRRQKVRNTFVQLGINRILVK